MPSTESWVALVGIATNFTIIVTGVKLIRHLSRMELKVEMMWGVFMRQFGTRHKDINLGKKEIDE